MAVPSWQYPFAAIGRAIRARLVERLSTEDAPITPDYVIPVANDDYSITVAEPFFLYLRFFGVRSPRDPALSYENAGAGNRFRPVARVMRVYVYTRTGEDSYGEDTIALFGYDPSQTEDTPPTPPGQFAMEERVFAALSDWTPTQEDEDENLMPMTIGPLHPIEASEYPERKKENDAGLVRSCLDFEIVYTMPLDPTEPPN